MDGTESPNHAPGSEGFSVGSSEEKMEDELERGLLLPQGGGGGTEYHRLSSDVIERTTVLIRPSRRHASARPRTARGVGRVSAGDTSLSLSLSLSLCL